MPAGGDDRAIGYEGERLDDIGVVLAEMDRDLTPSTEHDDPGKDTLYHYTTAFGLEGILRSKTVWATDYRYLNDAAEMVIAERVVDEQAKELLAEVSDRASQRALEGFLAKHRAQTLTSTFDVLVASFSQDPDLLSQWRAYGGDGAGYALGFDGLGLPLEECADDPDAGLWLIKCEYDRQKFTEDVRQAFRSVVGRLPAYFARASIQPEREMVHAAAVAALLQHAGAWVPRLKHHAFRAEAEWRYVVLVGKKECLRYRTTSQGFVPYYEIPLLTAEGAQLSRVVVGPSMHENEARNTEAFMRQLDFEPEVVASSIPYRSGTRGKGPARG